MVPVKKSFKLFDYVHYLLKNKKVNKRIPRWELEDMSH